MQSLLQIIKLNDPRSGKTAAGREWEMQEAECIILNDDGTPAKVGVLVIPKELMGKVALGTFVGSFALDASYKDRRIEARLVGLQAYVARKAA